MTLLSLGVSVFSSEALQKTGKLFRGLGFLPPIPNNGWNRPQKREFRKKE